MQAIGDNYQVEGNKECLAMMEFWYNRAKQGKVNFVAIVACEGPEMVLSDHLGVCGTEFAAHFGLVDLAENVKIAVKKRQAPPTAPDTPANQVVCNLQGAPSSFDFLPWILHAEMYRVQQGAPGPLKVGFSWGEGNRPEMALFTEHRKTMFKNVIKPLLRLVGAEEDETVVTKPALWHNAYVFAPLVNLYTQGCKIPEINPSAEAVARVEEMLQGREPVTITLREAEHWKHRNSSNDEWLKFAHECLKDEFVIILRDSAVADEPLLYFNTFPEAAKDLDTRIALYQRAKCNLFVANGPATLAWMGDRPWMMFCPIDADTDAGSGVYKPGGADWWKKYHGVAKGEQFPWSGPQQKIIWDGHDTYENIRKNWKAMFPAKRKRIKKAA